MITQLASHQVLVENTVTETQWKNQEAGNLCAELLEESTYDGRQQKPENRYLLLM